uniref:Uncharacterized protein n=1 Tax=Mucochytrium quahogii TaxID=96639 RepID=A0A7S2RGE5_9STRA|mmetsp:Transcript_14753/g.23996  ORF Transcript_14753/g.23996 Transcript_14753/m.23996 type:complete len:368 (+) Transcript_14753:37-1140(+)
MRVRRAQEDGSRVVVSRRVTIYKRTVTIGSRYWKEFFLAWLVFVGILWLFMPDMGKRDKEVAPVTKMVMTKKYSEFERLAVVTCDNICASNIPSLSWVPVPFLTVKSSVRKVNESLGWVRFLVENYDNLPKYVVFLHGHRQAWHTPPNYHQMLVVLQPKTYILLSAYHPSMWFTSIDDFEPKQGPILERLSDSLFELPFPQVFDETGLKWHQCCGEMVVSRESILRNPVSFYKSLIAKIESTEHGDDRVAWAYIMERAWGLLFGKFDGTPEFQTCYYGEVDLPVSKGVGDCAALCKGYKYVSFGGDESCKCGNSDLEILKSKHNNSATYSCKPCSLYVNEGMLCGHFESFALYKFVSLRRKRNPLLN